MKHQKFDPPPAGESGDAAPSVAATQDPGLAALVRIARFHAIAANAEQLRHTAALLSDTFGASDLLLAAKSLGLKARRVSVRLARLSRVPFPALVLDRSGRHFILAGCDGEKALVMEAGANTPEMISPDKVYARSGGSLRAHRWQVNSPDSTFPGLFPR